MLCIALAVIEPWVNRMTQSTDMAGEKKCAPSKNGGTGFSTQRSWPLCLCWSVLLSLPWTWLRYVDINVMGRWNSILVYKFWRFSTTSLHLKYWSQSASLLELLTKAWSIIIELSVLHQLQLVLDRNPFNEQELLRLHTSPPMIVGNAAKTADNYFYAETCDGSLSDMIIEESSVLSAD